LPENKEEPISAKAVVSFEFHPKDNRGLQLDFKAEESQVNNLKINGNESEIHFENEHLVFSADALNEGKNTLELEFTAGNSALNRRSEFMYTLFVPDRARTAFPAFDQPDLKAEFILSLRIPEEWKAIANANLAETETEDQHRILHFE